MTSEEKFMVGMIVFMALLIGAAVWTVTSDATRMNDMCAAVLATADTPSDSLRLIRAMPECAR